MFWNEVKRVRKRVQGEEIGVKDNNKNMLIDGKEVRHRWVAYFDKLLNVQDGVQASIVAVRGERRMPVFGRLNHSGVKGYEEEEGMSKFKGSKTTELNK